jgi:hypothetical protein
MSGGFSRDIIVKIHMKTAGIEVLMEEEEVKPRSSAETSINISVAL